MKDGIGARGCGYFEMGEGRGEVFHEALAGETYAQNCAGHPEPALDGAGLCLRGECTSQRCLEEGPLIFLRHQWHIGEVHTRQHRAARSFDGRFHQANLNVL